VGMYVTPQTPTSPLTQHTSKSYGSTDSRKGLGREQLNVQRSPRERCSRHAGTILQNPRKATVPAALEHYITAVFQAAEKSHLLQPSIVNLLSASLSSCTLAQYLSYHRPWLQFASEKHIAPLPIDPFEFSAFLISSSSSDRSAAPTKARCQAASFFSHLSGAHSPLQHPVCALVRDALMRKHASVRHPKTPLMAQHVRAMLLQHLTSQPNLATLLMSHRVAFMYEGCLRWSDLHQLTFGDCKQTPSSLRLCIPAAKNDHQHQGQWATIPASSDPLSAYMLYT
jgi:hypothetical protein